MGLNQVQARKVEVAVKGPEDEAAENKNITPEQSEAVTVSGNSTTTETVYTNTSGEDRIFYSFSTQVDLSHPTVDYSMSVKDGDDVTQFKVYGEHLNDPILKPIALEDQWYIDFKWDNRLPIDVNASMNVMIRPPTED